MDIRKLLVVAAGGLLAAGCGGEDTSEKSFVGEPGVETANHPLPVQANVVHRNALGVPSFSWLSPVPGQTLARTGATAKQVAWGTVRGLARTYQLGDHALDSISLSRVHDAGKGPIVAQFEQQVDGLEVWGGRLSIAMTRGNEPVAASGSPVPSIQPLPQRAFSLDARAAVVQAIHAMLGRTIGAGDVIRSGTERASYESHAVLLGRQVAQVRTKRLWYPQHKGLEPAWYVELDVPRDNSVESAGKSFIVSAHDGAVLFQKDLTAYEAYTYRVWGDNGGPFGPAPQDNPFGTVTTPHPTGLPDGAACSHSRASRPAVAIRGCRRPRPSCRATTPARTPTSRRPTGTTAATSWSHQAARTRSTTRTIR
jgi:large repetitive protein